MLLTYLKTIFILVIIIKRKRQTLCYDILQNRMLSTMSVEIYTYKILYPLSSRQQENAVWADQNRFSAHP